MVAGAVVVAGTNSGVGKTSLAVGLMAALRRRGLTVQAFKVGPDFLDPLHHDAATGRPSINLDGWMMDRQQNLAAFHRAAGDADIAVIEGVMGLFDGRDGTSEDGSTAQMAKWLGVPVLLVLDCWSLARSAAAMVKGYLEFDKQLRIGGLLLNRVGGVAHTKWLQDAIAGAGVQARFLGGIPKDDGIIVKERYLGLHMPGEEGVPVDHIDRLADLLDGSVDMDAVLALANSAKVPLPPQTLQQPLPPPSCTTVRVGVAQDAAFGFYYRDNLALLQAAGAELIFFSPMEHQLPPSISGLYLGGGYPERHHRALSANSSLRSAIAAFAQAGGVVYAECGGLMYLSRSLQPVDNLPAPMVGVFPFRTVMTPKMKMGYVEVETQSTCRLFPQGAKVRGHVYHFSEMVTEQVVSGLSALPDSSGRGSWEHAYRATIQVPGAEPVDEGYTSGNVLASYVHLHFGSAPQFAETLVSCCRSVDTAAVNAAASAAVMQATMHRRGNSDVGVDHSSQGSGHRSRRHQQQLAMPHVRSTPNLAELPHHSRAPRRGRTCSEQSSEGDDFPCSSAATSPSSVRRHSGGVSSHGLSDADWRYSGVSRAVDVDFHRHSSGLVHQPALPDASRHSHLADPDKRLMEDVDTWSESRELKGLSSRPGSPATTLQQISSMNDMYSPNGSPMGTPPNEDFYGTAGRPYQSAVWDARHTNGMPRSTSGLLPSSAPEPLAMQRSASAASPSAFAVVAGLRPAGKARPVNLLQDRLHPSASIPAGRLEERQRQYKTWPGGAGRDRRLTNGSMAHSRSTPLPNDAIVSLLPSGTEIVFALGLSGRLVGVSDQCNWPAEAKERPTVSRSRVDCRGMTPAQIEAAMQAFKEQGVGAYEVDEQALAALAPGLVLTQDACPTCDADASSVVAALQRAGLLGPAARTPACVLNLAPRTMADTLDCILEVGRAAGVAQEAGALVDRLRVRLRCVAAAVCRVARRPRVLSLEGLTPLALGGQWLPDVKELAGGSDDWQQPGDSPVRIQWEQVQAYAPEVLVLCPCGASPAEGVQQATALAQLPGWWSLPAVRNGRVFVADHSLFSRPGPRLVEGVEALARMLHPSLVSKRIPEGLVLKLNLSGGQRCRQSALPSCFVAYS